MDTESSTDEQDDQKLEYSKRKQFSIIFIIALLLGAVGLGLYVQRSLKSTTRDPMEPLTDIGSPNPEKNNF